MSTGAAGTARDTQVVLELTRLAKDIRESANLRANLAWDDTILSEIAIADLAQDFPRLNARRVMEAARAGLDQGGLPEPIRLEPSKLSPVEFVVDGFIQTGISVIAGQTGAGKTTCLTPLACMVAGLYGQTELTPEFRRKIYYLAEDHDQVNRILFTVKQCSSIAEPEFREWFNLFPSKRVTPGTLAAWIRRWSEEGSYIHENGHTVGPLIIIDTANANVDLTDENDNAAVGRTMSLIRESLDHSSVWIVSHLAKTLSGSSDPAALQSRGAGAWEADANQTLSLVHDERLLDKRFLLARKTRFCPEFRELEFHSETSTATAHTPWGSIQRVPLRTVKMTALRESGGLAAQRSELAQKAREEQAQLLRQRILDYLNKEADLPGWRGLTEKAITDTLGGKRAYVIEALSKLTEEGSVCVQRQGTANNSPKLHWPRNRPPK